MRSLSDVISGIFAFLLGMVLMFTITKIGVYAVGADHMTQGETSK